MFFLFTKNPEAVGKEIYLFHCILLDTFLRDLKTLVFITFRRLYRIYFEYRRAMS